MVQNLCENLKNLAALLCAYIKILLITYSTYTPEESY